MLARRSGFLFALPLTLWACHDFVSIGGDGESPLADDAGSPTADAATPIDAGPPHPAADGGIAPLDAGTPTIDEATVLCPWGMPPDAGIPNADTKQYRRDCTTTADCAVGKHMVDCCGSERALGVRSSEKSRFDAPGGICTNELATCDCAGYATRGEDDLPSRFADGHDIAVTCRAHRCTTFVTTFDCGSQQCDSRTQFCEVIPPGIPFPDGGTPPSSYACQPIPQPCLAAAREGVAACACIAPQEAAVDGCTEPDGHVTVYRMSE